MISNEVRDQVRARIDLADLVGQYVPLRRAGHSMIARCPFHEEKTPSFHVSRERGLYHCFGCKAAGDLFSFYERIEGVSFPEALRALAQRAGVVIEETDRDPARIAEEQRSRQLVERLQFACEVAAAFYEECLQNDHDAPLARAELDARQVNAESIATFRLGYAPAQWNALADHFRKRGVSPADGETAGLLLPGKRGGHYDRFRHRVMFPVWDRQGKVVGFSGRVLPVTEAMGEGIVPEDAGKYINSPETPLFKKSDLLFGLQVARNAMRHSAEALLVEGNFDVVALHQHGFANAIAPLGTSFTENQARLLRRYAETVTLMFDADNAGRKALVAAHGVCSKAGLAARVAVLSGAGKDPDEVLRSEGGAELVKARVEHAKGMVEWLVDVAAADAGDSVAGRVAALRSLGPVLANVRDRLERDLLVQEAARALHVNARDVVNAMRENDSGEHANDGAVRTRETGTAVDDAPFRRLRSVNDQRGATDPVATATAMLVDAMMLDPEMLAGEVCNDAIAMLEHTFAQPLIVNARAQWQAAQQLDGPTLMALAPTERARDWLARRLVTPALNDETAREANRMRGKDALTRLRLERDKESAQHLKTEFAKAVALGDEARAGELSRLITMIEQRMIASRKNRGTA